MSQQAYDQFARFYDLLHQELTADIPFMLAMAETSDGPILELGCGSGRLLLPLAHAGYAVTGLDRSAPMLALASRRLAESPGEVSGRVTLVEAEMADFSLKRRDYGLALIGFNTLLHLQADQAAAALTCAGRHLQPNGRLVIDTLNPLHLQPAESSAGPAFERVLQDRDGDEWIVVMSSMESDEAAQEARVVWIFDASPARGGAVQRTIVQDRYTFHYPHQLEMMLARSGFTLEALLGDYARAPFDEAAERLIAVARLSPTPGPS